MTQKQWLALLIFSVAYALIIFGALTAAQAGCLVTRPSVSGSTIIICDDVPPITCHPPIGGVGAPTCY